VLISLIDPCLTCDSGGYQKRFVPHTHINFRPILSLCHL